MQTCLPLRQRSVKGSLPLCMLVEPQLLEGLHHCALEACLGFEERRTYPCVGLPHVHHLVQDLAYELPMVYGVGPSDLHVCLVQGQGGYGCRPLFQHYSCSHTGAAIGLIRASTRHCLVGSHAWDCAPHIHVAVAGSRDAQQRRHMAYILRRAERSAGIVMGGRLSILWATMCCWWS